jgi:SAM-dependent methyltransferase
MSRWGNAVTSSAEDAKRFWRTASLDVLYGMMDTPRWAWKGWLDVAAGVITAPGLVFEPGCGVGLLTESLPSGCTYYGCDINEGYVEEADRLYARPGVRFEVRDLDDILDAGEGFDWVVVTSLFGMFPEEESYRLIRRFWELTRRGLSVTTLNRRLYPRSRRGSSFDFTTHDPEELRAAADALPGAGVVELHHGAEYPRFRGHHWRRGLCLYVWRPAEHRRRSVPERSAETI